MLMVKGASGSWYSSSRILDRNINRQVARRRQWEGGKVDDLVVWDAVDVEFL